MDEEIPFVQGSPNQYVKGVYRNSMFLLPATPDEIRGNIHNLNNSSSRWDGITLFVLKQAFSNLPEPLCYTVNLSFEQGYIPEQLKIAEFPIWI